MTMREIEEPLESVNNNNDDYNSVNKVDDDGNDRSVRLMDRE